MDQMTKGWINGFAGMLIFSGSLPATRAAVAGFDPLFLTTTRASVAGILATGLVLGLRQKRPAARDLVPLTVVALCVVVGFPLLSALALTRLTSAHSLIFIGLLPVATAAFGVLRGHERPSRLFWLFSCIGAGLIAGFATTRGSSASSSADLLMVAGIAICGLGYAEGARLSKRLGGWQVISWALILSWPLMTGLALFTMPPSFAAAGPSAWIGLFYVSVFSMLIGFVFWYRGLAQGGTAAVGQLQLLQPFFGMALAAMVLHEPIGWPVVAVAAGVALCVLGAKRFA